MLPLCIVVEARQANNSSGGPGFFDILNKVGARPQTNDLAHRGQYHIGGCFGHKFARWGGPEPYPTERVNSKPEVSELFPGWFVLDSSRRLRLLRCGKAICGRTLVLVYND